LSRRECVECEAFIIGKFTEIRIGAVTAAWRSQQAEHANYDDPVIPFIFLCHNFFLASAEAVTPILPNVMPLSRWASKQRAETSSLIIGSSGGLEGRH
jgi:hypothetical protein